MTSYRLTYAHTPQVERFETYEDAVTAVREVFRDAALQDDNSDLTLVWRDEAVRDPE